MQTTSTSLFPFSVTEQDAADENFGVDAEYYEQDGQTFVVSFKGGGLEAFAIERSYPSNKLTATETPVNEFNWESAEQFRGSEFPAADYDALEFRQADDSIGGSIFS